MKGCTLREGCVDGWGTIDSERHVNRKDSVQAKGSFGGLRFCVCVCVVCKNVTGVKHMVCVEVCIVGCAWKP